MARQARKLSQRELSAKAGVPQSHISKIENGGSDIRLSSLIELARALELELVLVPRQVLPAVQTVLRSVPSRSTMPPATYRAVGDALRNLARLSAAHPEVKTLGKLQQTLRELDNMRLGPLELTRIEVEVAKLAEVSELSDQDSVIIAAARTLSYMRNQLAHAVPPAPKPAYSIEDDDDA